jgi:hypothetical protein
MFENLLPSIFQIFSQLIEDLDDSISDIASSRFDSFLELFISQSLFEFSLSYLNHSQNMNFNIVSVGLLFKHFRNLDQQIANELINFILQVFSFNINRLRINAYSALYHFSFRLFESLSKNVFLLLLSALPSENDETCLFFGIRSILNWCSIFEAGFLVEMIDQISLICRLLPSHDLPIILSILYHLPPCSFFEEILSNPLFFIQRKSHLIPIILNNFPIEYISNALKLATSIPLQDLTIPQKKNLFSVIGPYLSERNENELLYFSTEIYPTLIEICQMTIVPQCTEDPSILFESFDAISISLPGSNVYWLYFKQDMQLIKNAAKLIAKMIPQFLTFFANHLFEIFSICSHLFRSVFVSNDGYVEAIMSLMNVCLQLFQPPNHSISMFIEPIENILLKDQIKRNNSIVQYLKTVQQISVQIEQESSQINKIQDLIQEYSFCTSERDYSD